MTLTFLVFFLSFGNINVVRRDYQMVKNYNFSVRLSNGADDVSCYPRICPVSAQF